MAGIYDTPQLRLARPHFQNGLHHSVNEDQLALLSPLARSTGRWRSLQVNSSSVLLQHQDLLLELVGTVEGAQFVIVIAFDDESAGHSVERVESGGAVLVGVIPESAGRLA